MDMRKVDKGLWIVAVMAGLANYEGLSLATGADTFWQRVYCAAIAFGVYTTIAVFWHVVFNIVPQMEDRRLRIGVWLTTALGALFILCISAWWAVASLGGATAQQAIYDGVVAQAEQAFAASRASSGAFQAQMPGLEALNADLGAMTKCEKKGCVSAGKGARSISPLLAQLHDRAGAILTAARESKTRLDAMAGKGGACLAGMRQALSAPGPMQAREDELARQVDCFNGALGDLDNVAGGAGVAQALDTFTTGIVIPASIKSDKQKAAVDKVLAGLKQRTDELAQAARATVPQDGFKPVTMVRANAMVAVVRMWRTVVPAWATGICLDLAPLALLLLLAQKAASDRLVPDDSHLDRPVRDFVVMRRAAAELEPWPVPPQAAQTPQVPQPPQLPQRRPVARGMAG